MRKIKMTKKITWESNRKWRSKLENSKDFPKIVSVPIKWQKTYGKGTMVIPKPLDVDDLIRKIDYGKLATVNQIRVNLAKTYKADHTCPLTTGIFIRIVAETAEEDRRFGLKDITPYWRVIKSDGSLNPKFPGGIDDHEKNLESEGHKIEQSTGKKPPKVKDFNKYLINF
jgi:hypothetical protein